MSETAITTGTISYTGEASGHRSVGVRKTNTNRPALLPRNGTVKFKLLEAKLVPGKSDPNVTNLYTKVEMVAIDDKDTVGGQVVQTWDMISGAYSENARNRPGEPRIHKLRDFLICMGIKEATAVKLIPPGQGDVDVSKVVQALTKSCGREGYANAWNEKGRGKFADRWTSRLNDWIDPALAKRDIPISGYASPLVAEAQTYFDNPAPNKSVATNPAPKPDIDVSFGVTDTAAATAATEDDEDDLFA